MFDSDITVKRRDANFLDVARLFTGEIVYGVPKQTAWTRQLSTEKPVIKYNNAQILAVMEHGSPVKNIPPRELLIPVRKKYARQINDTLLKVCDLLLKSKQDEADEQMEKLAIRIENWTKKFFTDSDNGWAPNSPATIRAKGSDRPLIDTGALRQSIKAIYYKDGRNENETRY